jgi:hypothetical protein
VIAVTGGLQAAPALAAASTAGVAVSATVLAACTTPSPALVQQKAGDAGTASQDCAPYSVTLQPATDAQASAANAALLVSY